jgi:hypothetical protein
MAYNFQTGYNKMKLLTEYENVTQNVLFGNVVLAALMSGRKYDVMPQNVRTLVFRNKVRYENATSLQNPTQYGKARSSDNASVVKQRFTYEGG